MTIFRTLESICDFPVSVIDGINCCNKSLDFIESNQNIFSEWNWPLQSFWRIVKNSKNIFKHIFFILSWLLPKNLLTCLLMMPYKTELYIILLFSSRFWHFHTSNPSNICELGNDKIFHFSNKWRKSERSSVF